MPLILLLATILALLLPAVANAEGTIQSEVARTGVWANTSDYTPAVYGSGSSPCWTNVKLRSSNYSGVTPPLATRLSNTPLPCYFKPAGGTDGEAVVVDQTGTGYKYYELWTTAYNATGFPGWSVGWGGAADDSEFVQSEGLRVWPGWMGTQASGIAFLPGVPRIADLQAGVVRHPVQIEVPEACAYHKAPATRQDGNAGNTANCIPEGQKWKLPAGTDCTTGLRRLARIICAAVRDYYLVVTDMTHDKVTFRFEGLQPSSSPYYQGDPYWKTTGGGLFGCDGLGSNGQPVAHSWEEYDCYPTEQAVFYKFPWDKLVPVN
jgi:hypothetical protein